MLKILFLYFFLNAIVLHVDTKSCIKNVKDAMNIENSVYYRNRLLNIMQ